MKRISSMALVLVAVLLPAVANAGPSSADRAAARTLGHEGEAALARRDFAEAADRYTRAEALFHAPTLLLGLARAQVGLGKLVDAQETYQRIVAEGAPPGSPPIFVEAVAAAEKELAAVKPRIAWLTVTTSGRASATVRLDDDPLLPAALGVRRPVDPGTHTIVAQGDGVPAKTASVTLAEGQTEKLALDLAPEPSSGRGDAQRIAGVVVLGVGGVGIVVGAVAGALVVAQHGTLAAVCGRTCPPSQQSNVDGYHAKGWVSNIGLIGGVALAGAGASVWLTAPKRTTRTSVTVAPYVGPGAIGAAGRFW